MGFSSKLDPNGIVDWPAQLTAHNEIGFFSLVIDKGLNLPESPIIYAIVSMSNAGHNSLASPRST